METWVKCPYCKNNSLLNIDISPITSREDTIKTEIFKAIQSFLFWKIHGEPEYRKDQYFYDTYHQRVSYEHEKGSSGKFHFSIQMSDSPDGDWWIEGSVDVTGNIIHWDKLSINSIFT